MRIPARPPAGPATGRRRLPRLVGEVALVAVAIVLCVAAAGLAPADTALVVGLTVAVLVLLRSLPDADAPRLPRLPPDERSGRRADVYRLSWGVTSRDGVVDHQVLQRARTLVSERLATTDAASDPPVTDTGDPRHGHLTVLREAAAGPLRTGRLTPSELRRTLTALEGLDELDRRTKGTP